MAETNVDKIAATEGIRSGSADLIESELEQLDGITPGTGVASKCLIPDSNGDIIFPRYFKPSDAAPAAAGTNQATATALAKMVNAVTGADGAKGVALPAAEAGLDIWVINTDPAKPLFVYPVNGGNDAINALAANTAFILGPNKAARFHATSATQWYVDDIGGRFYSNVAAADNVTAAASNNAHVDFANICTILANTLKAGNITRIRLMVRVTDASGTDTLEVKLYIGGTTLVTTVAFDPDAAGDFVQVEFELVTRAAPGAAVEHVGAGRSVTSDGGTLAHGAAILAPTNLATNGALVVKASAKWSSNTASTSARLEALNVEIL